MSYNCIYTYIHLLKYIYYIYIYIDLDFILIHPYFPLVSRSLAHPRFGALTRLRPTCYDVVALSSASLPFTAFCSMMFQSISIHK